MNTLEIIFWGLLGGIIPPLIWVWFWLQEDRLHPEPRGLILRCFIGGMLSVMLALVAENALQSFFGSTTNLLLFLWAGVEEISKFLAAYLIAFRRNKEYDEPVDALIYFITVALGFAALENALFLISEFQSGNIIGGLATIDLRFIGATLLHVLSSSIIGTAAAWTYYKKKYIRHSFIIFALSAAILVHTLFNIFILKQGHVSNLFLVFSFVWVALMILLVVFEKIKRLPFYRYRK